MVSEKILFAKKFTVDLRDIDFKKKLKISSLFSYFQDTANLAAERLGVGFETLANKYSLAWVLARVRVDIERLPEWDEEIIIKTWPIEPNRFEFDRDFLVYDSNGTVIIRAISTWVVIDIKERKLKRADTIHLQYLELTKERAIPDKFRRLKRSENLEVVYKKTIGYSDVDFNGHLNNSKYVDYIMDCFPIEEHWKSDITSIEVHFVNEALPGETVLLLKQPEQYIDGIYIEGQKENDQTSVFKAFIQIKK